jgi:hypothetical protein
MTLFPAPTLKFTMDRALGDAISQARSEMVDLVKRGNEASRQKFEADRRTNPKAPRPTSWRLDAPFSLAIIDLGDGGAGSALKCGGYNADSLHYIASGAKLAALFAAYALRDMVWRSWLGWRTAQLKYPGLNAIGADPRIKPGDSLKQALNRLVDPAILTAAPASIRAAVSKHAPMVPAYDDVFTMPAAGSPAKPDFQGDFISAMRQMIVPSDNDAAGTCIRGVGYAYINAALTALHLPSKKGEPGVWLAGDYGTYTFVYVYTTNDALAAQCGSAMAMAQLMAMILNDGILTSGDCGAMRSLLADASKGVDVPFLTRSTIGEDWRIPLAKVTHAKLGRGPLDVGGNVVSETFRLAEPQKKGKNYCVAFQNVDNKTANLNEVAFTLHRAIELYES